MNKKIFVDLHDVLGDWEHPMLAKVNEILKSRGESEITMLWFNYVMLPEKRQQIVREVYAANPNFFSELPRTTWGEYILWVLNRFQSEYNNFTVHILSAIGEDHPDPEYVVAQNNLWLERNTVNVKGLTVPRFSVPIYVTRSKDKVQYAAPNAFLIDNFLRNVTSFKDAGGHGVRYYGSHTDEGIARNSYITTHQAIHKFLKS